MTTTNKELKTWVEEAARLTRPDRIHWCDGSEAEYVDLCDQMVADGTLVELNKDTNPRSYLHRSHPSDVARTEHLTYVCTTREADSGPTNNWMPPAEAHRKVDALFDGSMKGRTMYVVPYVMGPIDSPFARCGVELTDSPYVAASMKIMTRMGRLALNRIEKEGTFVKGLHSLGDLSPERRYIMHFPEELLIKSIGSGYGGNALLGKKCHALRIASHQARQEKWLAEHMLVMGVEDPAGETTYIAAAFPSACGKTNLGMLIPPDSHRGWRVHTIGEDIAWLHPGDDGRLWAINPEAGFFGVAPGTSPNTNANAVNMLHHDAIFTNVAMTRDGQPWWEGLTKTPPEGLTDWQGRPYDPANGPAAHPNSRFTVSARQCPSYSYEADAPHGVPISAILFGGRRASLAPLVYEALDWNHGVLVGAGVASETTAAAVGEVGVVRRDPMAMLPFCGYNMADYWGHWIDMGSRIANPPRVFHVNWFRRDADGNYIWPGFGENLRVLRWVIERCRGTRDAIRSPIGYLPTPGAIDILGLNIDRETMLEITQVDAAGWRKEMADIKAFLDRFGDRVPERLAAEHQRVTSELEHLT